MMKKKPSVLLAAMLAATVICTGLTGCGRESGSGGALTKVTLNEVAHSIFYAPMYVAIEEGYFEEEGIDLTLVNGFGADKVMTAVISGEVDLIAAAVAEKAIPECNIVYIDGDEMKEKLPGFLQILYDANPQSVGGAMPGDDFYYEK